MNEDDEEPDAWRGDEEEPLSAFDAKSHYAAHAAMAACALLSGAVSVTAASILPAPLLKRFFEEGGITLPATTELVLSWHLPLLGAALGLVAAIGIGWTSTLKKPRVSWPIGLGALVVCFLPMSLCVLHGMTARFGLANALSVADAGPGEREPGRTSEVADDVLEGLRAGLARGVGSFQTPSGERRRFFVAEGPGLPAAPRELPPYEQARELPGCVVLPWADAPAPNTDSQREAVLLFPHGAAGGVAPSALRGTGAEPWALAEVPSRFVTEEGTPASLYPAPRAVPGSDYSWALLLKRARVDANGDGVVSRGPRPFGPSGGRVKPADPFSDRLLEVRVQVFRGFDPAANPPRAGADSTQAPGVVPPSNVPQAAFVARVRLP